MMKDKNLSRQIINKLQYQLFQYCYMFQLRARYI